MSKHKRFIVNEDAMRELGYDEETIKFIKEETLKLTKLCPKGHDVIYDPSVKLYYCETCKDFYLPKEVS